MSSHPLLEVPITSVDDALAAVQGGADRLELNGAFALGGLTPSLGTFREVRAVVDLPIVVMIRPRPAGFLMSEGDWRTMRRDVELFLVEGADGIVFGILHADGTIDALRAAELRRQAESREAIFHRAFDVTPCPFQALQILCDLGFTRVLTSGQEPTALAGAPLLAELRMRAGDSLEILPGGGIRPENVASLLARTGCTQVHASLRSPRHDPSTGARPQVRFGTGSGEETTYDGTNPALVAAMVKALRREEV